jgi:threonine dehydratase
MSLSMTSAEDGYGFTLDGLTQATAIVRQAIAPTPQMAWPLLAARTGAEVWVKHENHLPTGAFKVRGGLVMMDAIKSGRLGKVPAGAITASVGNHGLSQAFAGARSGVKVAVVVPENNNPEKNAALKAQGAELIESGRDFSASYEVAHRLARERNLHMVESFHPELVRGVATGALEFFEGAPELDTIYVPIGLGSGICAMIRTRDLLGRKTKIVGVVSRHAAGYALSVAAGRVVSTETANTIADGMAVRVPNPQAVEIIGRGAERIVQVDDEEIAGAVRAYHEDTHNMAEGAGAAALAALLQERDRMRGKPVGLMLTGANISRAVLGRILTS